jgi:hypothetical protein
MLFYLCGIEALDPTMLLLFETRTWAVYAIVSWPFPRTQPTQPFVSRSVALGQAETPAEGPTLSAATMKPPTPGSSTRDRRYLAYHPWMGSVMN